MVPLSPSSVKHNKQVPGARVRPASVKCVADPDIFKSGSGISEGSDPDPVFPKVQIRIQYFRRVRPGSGISEGSDPDSVFPKGQTRMRYFRRVRSGFGFSEGSDPNPVFPMGQTRIRYFRKV